MIQMKIDFRDLFENIGSNTDILKAIDNDKNIMVLYGLSELNKKRLIFVVDNEVANINSTKVINVCIYKIKGKWWICFDLEENNFSNLFYNFCQDMYEYAISDSYNNLMLRVIERFGKWKEMFQKVSNSEISEEKEQGIFGELYFLYSFMFNKYGIEKSILSWGGPDNNSKDFSNDNTWYEIKTSGALSKEITISSLEQLDSDVDGFLVNINVEKMSNEFSNGKSSVPELFHLIKERIKDENVKIIFLSKIVELNVDTELSINTRKYDVKYIKNYLVNDSFPKLTKKNINHLEITDVSYKIDIPSLKRFEVDMNV